MTDRERDLLLRLTATLDRAAGVLADARAAGLEWDQLDGELCADHGDIACRAYLECWGWLTCHDRNHGDSCVIDELGAAR